MRSALLCVFLTLIIQREAIGEYDTDFRPTPIPLAEWHHDTRLGRAGTLHETIKTESPPSVAAVPAHYWEDALRHSVYLTLVRDKIDQLIAKGNVISPNSKPGSYDSKEIDDHDLWDKIKTAPFDRIQEEELGSNGDVTIMAKGRLLEEKGGFRFAEDERTKEKCSVEDCMRDVKAFWSVKRVRQRDQETSPGKYHYELTFSVISQTPKKQKKPYEMPIRTFTVKESSPNGVIERPKEYRKYEQFPTARPERAVWFHKNIAPAKQTGRKQSFQGLDRIFSTFFSDDEEKTYDPVPQKFKQGVTQPTPLFQKIGHSGAFIDPHPQIPFTYRPHPPKYIHPPLQAPPVNQFHQYSDMSLISSSNNNPYVQYPYDHRVEPSQVVKTVRPAILPTPLPPIMSSKEQYNEMANTLSFASIDNTSLAPENGKMQKPFNKYKSTTLKVNYFSDHVRPPVYNAPPGVFVTMDKKPFKPMPPLKLTHSSKPYRTNKPIDFRPSPQILDIQNTDSFSDSAFRPITLNFAASGSSEKMETIEFTKKDEQKIRKPIGKKPFRKHDNIKSRVTSPTPDIITAKPPSEEVIETMDWANVLGAFTRTTPMVSQTDKANVSETTTPMTSTMIVSTTIRKKDTSTTEEPRETTISTTVRPKKRTRPPPKFVKNNKIKKHKRITSTTTTTTNAPETIIKKKTAYDLTPLATSAATKKSFRDFKNKTIVKTTTTTNTPSTTSISETVKTTTSQPTTTISTTVKTPSTSTIQPKDRNRFRQSTLMLKGTSVKHDRWSGIQKNHTSTAQSLTAAMHRRKGSKFKGYVSTTTPRISHTEPKEEKDNLVDINVSTESSTTKITEVIKTTSAVFEETDNEFESNSEEHDSEKVKDTDYDDVSKDHSEYIFQSTIASTSNESNIEMEINTLQPSAHTLEASPTKNKTKCKKKTSNISTTQATTDTVSSITDKTTKSYSTVATPKTTKEPITTDDILQDFFNLNFNDDSEPVLSDASKGDLQNEETTNSESFLKFDDFEDLLDIHLTGSTKKHTEFTGNDEQYQHDDDDEEFDDDEDDEYENGNEDDTLESDPNEDEGDEETGKHNNDSNVKGRQPLSFLELMAMS